MIEWFSRLEKHPDSWKLFHSYKKKSVKVCNSFMPFCSQLRSGNTKLKKAYFTHIFNP